MLIFSPNSCPLVVVIAAATAAVSIYKGWLPTVLKVSTAQATRFGVFQVVKSSPYYGKDTPGKAAAAGAFSGATSVILFQVCLCVCAVLYIRSSRWSFSYSYPYRCRYCRLHDFFNL